tara:strand:- start:3051 stop:4082 length:1032 start_codon:yes stop_codon:yes gene_type:complete
MALEKLLNGIIRTSKMNFYKNKNVLVTGGTGMIGIPLVKKLLKLGSKVTIVSLDDKKLAPTGTKFIKSDLREFKNCMRVCNNKDYVFHLAGIKGSPLVTKTKPASFFVPTLTFSVNMMEAARRNKVKRYLLTSSVGVYGPKEIFKENDVWKSFPSENDRFAGWAKRMCELQAQAYQIEYNWKDISIVRPANVYGPYDNFDTDNAMVIPSLINKATTSKKFLEIWGDGEAVRDFVYSEDVAEAMIYILKKGFNKPVNIGSGKGYKIKKIAEIISKNVKNGPLKLKFDLSKPSGDNKRLMDTKILKNLGFRKKMNIEKNIINTLKWFENYKNKNYKKYNSFKEQK